MITVVPERESAPLHIFDGGCGMNHSFLSVDSLLTLVVHPLLLGWLNPSFSFNTFSSLLPRTFLVFCHPLLARRTLEASLQLKSLHHFCSILPTQLRRHLQYLRHVTRSGPMHCYQPSLRIRHVITLSWRGSLNLSCQVTKSLSASFCSARDFFLAFPVPKIYADAAQAVCL